MYGQNTPKLAITTGLFDITDPNLWPVSLQITPTRYIAEHPGGKEKRYWVI